MYIYIYPSYMLRKIFDNKLFAIRKSNVTPVLYKPAYTGTCILKLGKVLTHGFRYDFIKNKYDNKSRLLFIETDCLI